MGLLMTKVMLLNPTECCSTMVDCIPAALPSMHRGDSWLEFVTVCSLLLRQGNDGSGSGMCGLTKYAVVGVCGLWVLGCSVPVEVAPPAPDFTPHGAWVYLSENDWESSSYTRSEDDQGSPTGEFTFACKNTAFEDLMEKVSRATGCSIACADPTLLLRGINIEFTGIGPEGVVRSMASELGLAVVIEGPTSSTVTYPDGF